MKERIKQISSKYCFISKLQIWEIIRLKHKNATFLVKLLNVAILYELPLVIGYQRTGPKMPYLSSLQEVVLPLATFRLCHSFLSSIACDSELY